MIEGEANKDVYINKIFEGLDEDGKIKGTEHDIWKSEDSTIWGPDNFVWDITHLINK